jgi:peptidoglycan/xylan/chitin deacetylase (PgdA/CDA1 family)
LTQKLLEPFQQDKVRLTAFVITGNCSTLTPEQQRTVLKIWSNAGAELGNHTYSHRGLNDMPIEEYEQDILRADSTLRNLLGSTRIRYFRSPMLQTGPTREIKDRLERFLAAHGYRQAPVTLDNSDWMFAYVYNEAITRGDQRLARQVRNAYIPYMESIIAFFEQRAVEVVGREFPQVLLLHANRLNAEMGPELLSMLKNRGYRFVSLDQALRDEAYGLPNGYAGKGGFSWLHRWSMTKGMPNKGEPDEPDWLRKEWKRLRSNQQ